MASSTLRPPPYLPRMHEITTHGDVTRVRLWSRPGVAVGYDVSVYLARGVLIDTGFPRAHGELRALVEALRPRGALVTHWHEDHAGNVPLLAEMGLPLGIAHGTLERLRAHPRIRLYRRVVWGRPAPLAHAPQSFADDALAMLPTPGHSPDHHVVWDAERETLFSGDLWLGVRARVMHEHEAPRTLLASLRRVAALRPRHMFDAHRGEVSDPPRALAARIEFLERTIDAVQRRVDAGWGDAAIVRTELEGEEAAAWFSLGEYARRNLVRAVRRGD